jgi:hypothetical protein
MTRKQRSKACGWICEIGTEDNRDLRTFDRDMLVSLASQLVSRARSIRIYASCRRRKRVAVS